MGPFVEQQPWAQQTDGAISMERSFNYHTCAGINDIPDHEKAQNQPQVVPAKRDAQHAVTAGLGCTGAGPYR